MNECNELLDLAGMSYMIMQDDYVQRVRTINLRKTTVAILAQAL
jgi:hypothetical protein